MTDLPRSEKAKRFGWDRGEPRVFRDGVEIDPAADEDTVDDEAVEDGPPAR